MALITIREAARRLHVHENTVRNWLDQEMLRGQPMPGSGFRRVVEEDVDRLALWSDPVRRGHATALHVEP